VSGVVYVTGFTVGDKITIEIDHNALYIAGSTDTYARFADCPLPYCAAAGGWIVRPLSDGTSGTQFRFELEYTGYEYIYDTSPYGYLYPTDTFVYEVPTSGVGTITWYRHGILADTA